MTNGTHRDRGLVIGVATTILGIFLLMATPVAGAVPIPLSSLPIVLPSLPLPTLPSLPLPTLPVILPTPTLPVPTPSLPVPTPTLPVPPPPVLPSGSPSPATSPSMTASNSVVAPGSSVVPSPTPRLTPPAAAGPVAPSTGPDEGGSAPLGGRRSLFDALVAPGLAVGIPLTVIVVILAAQVGAGLAWLPIIRRWRNRRV